MKTLTTTLLALAMPLALQAQTIVAGSEALLSSPDGRYEVRFCQRLFGEARRMIYAVNFNGEPLIAESELGVDIENGLSESALGIPNGNSKHWGDNLRVTDMERTSVDTTWHPLYGERREVRDCYNALTVKLQKGDDTGKVAGDAFDHRHYYYMNVELRAYNEGVAVRYYFPEATNGLYLHITADHTTFTLPAATEAWHERWAQGPFHKVTLDQWQGESERPLLLRRPNGTYLAIGEAGLVDFVRGKIDLVNNTGEERTLGIKLYESADIITPYATPWRVIMAGQRAVDLINNNHLFLNLNAPCQIADTDFIRPGKVFRVCSLKKADIYAGIDFAAERGLQYIELDAGWYGPEATVRSKATQVASTRDFYIADVCQKARAKGLGVVLYVNQRALYTQLDSILPLYRQWGVAAIKFGFVQVGNQHWTTWLHNAVRRCAEYGLMVDIHDEYRPTGFSRTYPNLMTQEGVRGNEEMPDAENNTLLPFTRFLCGPADYTLCYFNSRVKNTKTHQLAMAAVYFSPLQFMFWYDRPADCHDEAELKFWHDIPTVWDDSRALDGSPGEFIVQARRSGNHWYVGAMNGLTAREISINTADFLEKGKKYRVEIYTDDAQLQTRTQVAISTLKTVKYGKTLTLHLPASGGAALHFLPIND